MAKRTIDGIAVEISLGNAFADLGLADAEQPKIKSGLVIEITKRRATAWSNSRRSWRTHGYFTSECLRSHERKFCQPF